MASPPGLFYAYAKNIRDDWSYRYIIAFESRQVSDEWWRVVTASVDNGYPRFAGVKRLSAQWYTHDPAANAFIHETINDPKCAPQFLGKVMFTLLNDRDARTLSVSPVLNFADHVNGGTFFIRSTLRPELFWYYHPDIGQILASTSRRTRFDVRIAAKDKALGTIMIGSDKVSISVAGQQDFNVGVATGSTDLAIQKNGLFQFDFSDFNDGNFGLNFLHKAASGDFVQGVVATVTRQNYGERWELVL
ncbi:protein [Laccaria bicolor S238N-H82] XP_001878005 [Lentinula edodes]|uniref:Protein [Laccaria bicolor S238N-H82] XP_001878005 n=1 Tax=Lentinula edodes TaxID=5353 RepID=A0A1Q3E0E3_LENED|nr:protein [Laccaria bicolor S238N-H82] XP_001878005 [Lentinula edodes]